MNRSFSLLLFSTKPTMIIPAVEAGVDGIIVDWERIGKQSRQAFANTQINQDTLEDLKRVRNCTRATVICRINGYGENSKQEIDDAIDAGTDEILLPMVRNATQVEILLEYINKRCDLGILLETIDAMQCLNKLACLPLSRVYVGLNDLAIERGTNNIFSAVTDGTVEAIRSCIPQPFGFAGITLPDKGHPIPCRLLINEMARLNCEFSFLRRSFHHDIQGRDISREIPRIQQALENAHSRTKDAIEQDRVELAKVIHNLGSNTLLKNI